MKLAQTGEPAPVIKIAIEEDHQMPAGKNDRRKRQSEFDALSRGEDTGSGGCADSHRHDGRDAKGQRSLLHMPVSRITLARD
ncbi:MAG: hypothetical protein E6G89_00615 [Alphaproteobacteria bacterium]|nr:MAG: hypothetical protein E6G89_00615 [Alphaproteobacteria bacterium]